MLFNRVLFLSNMMTQLSLSLEPVPSIGTLLTCTEMECLWADGKGNVINNEKLILLLKKANDVHTSPTEYIHGHMQSMEDLFRLAKKKNHTLSYAVGVSELHLFDQVESPMDVQDVLLSDQLSFRVHDTITRKLQEETYFNWCDKDANPSNRSVCSSVKSQQQCGSCWAFAAADAIETAVSVAEGTDPIPLSPQQFLDCSTAQMQSQFSYCWLNAQTSSAVPWLQSTIQWYSDNEGCNGGMTHAAFQYAAYENPQGLLAEIQLPYTEGDGGPQKEECSVNGEEGAARISGWRQIVGTDCSAGNDPNLLLRAALQGQPISVAVSSKGAFKNYKSGIYKCANNGNLPQHTMIDHALLLVGYGTDPVEGDYWILKNSYGTGWGENGYMRIQADEKVNCGINIYPVIPLGATTGEVELFVDGGGSNTFLNLSFDAWITIAIVASISTVLIITAGIIHSRRRAQRIRNLGQAFL